MTRAGLILLGAMRRNLELLAELDMSAPADVDQIVAALVGHLRSWRPMALATLDTGPVARI